VDGTNATFSPCRSFRYTLVRDLERPMFAARDGYVLFVMLNPSTADELADDPTIRRCLGFAERWGFSRVMIGNLFAWRSTDPKALRTVADPVGPENDAALARMAAGASRIVCAWGANVRKGPLRERPDFVGKILRASVKGDTEIVALRLLDDGVPEHPLYLPYTVTPVAYGPQSPANTNGAVGVAGTGS
jgi:hypothetical protein